jgi:uncharacterized coiled-coil DUF342 family protein
MTHAKQKIEETREKIESYSLAIKEKSKAISKAQREKFKLQEQILFSQLTLRGSDFEIYDKVRENLNNQMEESKNLTRKIDILRNEHVALQNELAMQKELFKIRIEDYRKTNKS